MIVETNKSVPTKHIMRTDKTSEATKITIGEDLIEEVLDFDYLGSLITNNGDGDHYIDRHKSLID